MYILHKNLFCLLCHFIIFVCVTCPSAMCRANVCSAVSDYDLSTELGLIQCDYIESNESGRINPGKNDLSIIQINVRGLLNKQDHLRDIIRSCHPDVILVCETWLTSKTTDLVDIAGYKLNCKNRVDRIGGGVGVLIKKDLRSRQRN